MVSRTLRGALTALLAAALASCATDPTGPSSNFLLHAPFDNPSLAHVAGLQVSPTRTDSALFAWEPAPHATRYEIAFWRAESREEVMIYQVDTSGAPTLRIPVDAPVLTQRPINMARPEGPTTPVVVHLVPYAELDRLLRDAGLEGSGPYFFVWSVFAEGNGRRVRSIERHRVALVR